ncbi:hypothetical protein CEXT_508581 [Caerostris extrusa]|uniref:Uncharacterized protein n=1 Tax=Caerostris extrusa TaxID=172846 RepID=A0AAV4MCR8_CAEEX|nr:hypothetical protein CEXT_508581 [Caerostris extrusa]
MVNAGQGIIISSLSKRMCFKDSEYGGGHTSVFCRFVNQRPLTDSIYSSFPKHYLRQKSPASALKEKERRPLKGDALPLWQSQYLRTPMSGVKLRKHDRRKPSISVSAVPSINRPASDRSPFFVILLYPH